MLTPKEREAFAFKVTDEVRRWPGVEIKDHASGHEPGETDGVEFRLFGRQIGHVHLDCGVHLSLTRKLKEHVVNENLAEDLTMASGSGWAMFNPIQAADADHAIWLLRLNYVRLKRQRLTLDAAAGSSLLQQHEAALALRSMNVTQEVRRTRARAPRPIPSLEPEPPQLTA